VSRYSVDVDMRGNFEDPAYVRSLVSRYSEDVVIRGNLEELGYALESGCSAKGEITGGLEETGGALPS